MSGDPERLLSVSGGESSLERELLESVRDVGPPRAAKEEAWRAIAAQVAVATAVGTAAGSTAAATSKAGASALASWALSTKVAVVALGGGLALGGGYLGLREPNAPPPVAARAPAAPRDAQERSVVAPTAAPNDWSSTTELPAEEPPPRKLEPRRSDSLKAESALLMQARSELRSGNAAGAQSVLERLQAQFPQGMLAQEREVLAIEVLQARGNVESAKRRARAFIRAYPKSPHSQKLARFVE
ncbi:MAG: outer membrane protein assembly factor BamD [Myxococcales bacterium]|nr:MAG: outer membrane protein assembly factor BamD [Myxococcales bacterium]